MKKIKKKNRNGMSQAVRCHWCEKIKHLKVCRILPGILLSYRPVVVCKKCIAALKAEEKLLEGEVA